MRTNKFPEYSTAYHVKALCMLFLTEEMHINIYFSNGFRASLAHSVREFKGGVDFIIDDPFILLFYSKLLSMSAI